MTVSQSTLLRTGDVLVIEDGDTIRFRPIGAVLLGLGTGSLVLALAFRLIGRLEILHDDAGLLAWASWVLMVCGALLTAAGIARHVSPPWELDARRRLLVRGRRQLPFADLANVQVTSTRLGRTTAVALRVDTPEGQIWLVTGQMEKWRDDVHRVADRITAKLGDSSIPSLAVTASPRSFLVPFAVTLGVVWAGGLWWFAPNLIVTPPNGTHGLRMWPLGVWIAGLGIAELARLPVFEIMLGPWNRRRTVMFMVWMGSYAIFAYTRIAGS